jgi:hypothetical protein
MAGSELALQGGAINASTVSEALTKTLEDTLLAAGSAEAAAKTIARSPKLLAEAQEKLSLVLRLAAPISSEQLYAELQPLLIMFNGAPDFGQDPEADKLQVVWFDIYAKALAKMPVEAVNIAVSEWMRVGKPFFPKPSELHKLAEPTATEINMIAWRLKKSVEDAAQHRTVDKSPEEIERVKAMIDELRGPDGKISLASILRTT